MEHSDEVHAEIVQCEEQAEPLAQQITDTIEVQIGNPDAPAP